MYRKSNNWHVDVTALTFVKYKHSVQLKLSQINRYLQVFLFSQYFVPSFNLLLRVRLKKLCSHRHQNMFRVNMFQRNAFPQKMFAILLFTLVNFKEVSLPL